MIKLKSIAHKLFTHPFKATKEWWLGLPARPTRISVLLCALIAVLGVTSAIMWTRINNEAKARCESLNVVAELFVDVGSRSEPPNANIMDLYTRAVAYASNNPDDAIAVLVVTVLSESLDEAGSEAPLTDVLNEAGREIEAACSV